MIPFLSPPQFVLFESIPKISSQSAEIPHCSFVGSSSSPQVVMVLLDIQQIPAIFNRKVVGFIRRSRLIQFLRYDSGPLQIFWNKLSLFHSIQRDIQMTKHQVIDGEKLYLLNELNFLLLCETVVNHHFDHCLAKELQLLCFA